MKKVEINEETAKSLLSGKPAAKGKKRRTEIEDEHALENRMTDKLIAKKRPRSESESDSKVGAKQLRGVMTDTMCRVYEEIWPGMVTYIDYEPDVEIAEEAYILCLTMIVGNPEDIPRKGLKIRDVEISDKAVYCEEHAA